MNWYAVLQTQVAGTDIPPEMVIPLAFGGSIAVGSLVLLQVQAAKHLAPVWLEGKKAIVATFLFSLVAQLIGAGILEIDFVSTAGVAGLYVATLTTFVSAVTQYSFLFHRGVQDSPLPPDAEAPADAFTVTGEETAEDEPDYQETVTEP